MCFPRGFRGLAFPTGSLQHLYINKTRTQVDQFTLSPVTYRVFKHFIGPGLFLPLGKRYNLDAYISFTGSKPQRV